MLSISSRCDADRPTRTQRQRATVVAALARFDALPDCAFVKASVVAALRGTCTATVRRHVRDGLLPAPVETAPRALSWRVGDLRRALERAK